VGFKKKVFVFRIEFWYRWGSATRERENGFQIMGATKEKNQCSSLSLMQGIRSRFKVVILRDHEGLKEKEDGRKTGYYG